MDDIISVCDNCFEEVAGTKEEGYYCSFCSHKGEFNPRNKTPEELVQLLWG